MPFFDCTSYPTSAAILVTTAPLAYDTKPRERLPESAVEAVSACCSMTQETDNRRADGCALGSIRRDSSPLASPPVVLASRPYTQTRRDFFEHHTVRENYGASEPVRVCRKLADPLTPRNISLVTIRCRIAGSELRARSQQQAHLRFPACVSAAIISVDNLCKWAHELLFLGLLSLPLTPPSSTG